MLTVGLDLHMRCFALCVLDRNGKVMREKTLRGGWKELRQELLALRSRFQLCFEASGGYGVWYERLTKLAARVVVAHPSQLRLIFRSRRKNDRIDARKLATLLYLDQVPPVYVPCAEVRSWRSLVEHRTRLIDKRTKAKNGLRSLLRSFDVTPPGKSQWLWSLEGRLWLAKAELPTDTDALRRDTLLAELEHFEEQIKRVTSCLNEIGRGHPSVVLLQTIPGVGMRTAEAVVAYIDDPGRFGRLRSVGSYFGLVPRQSQSAERNHLGQITKSGPATVRRLLTEAAWQTIRRNEQMRAFFDRLMRGDPQRRKIALIATAHRLLRIMLAMLRTGEIYRLSAHES